MINIAKRKIPHPVLALVLYISYCASSWFAMRGNLAYLANDFPAWFVNDAWAFFLGGLIPTLLFELIASFAAKSLIQSGGDVPSIRQGMYITVIAANVVLFGLKFIYIAAPLAAGILETILDPTVTLIFVGLYLWYAFYQNYVAKEKYRMVVMVTMSMFISIYGLLTLINLFMSIAG